MQMQVQCSQPCTKFITSFIFTWSLVIRDSSMNSIIFWNRKLMSGKGSGIADQILQAAPDGCEIKIICQGNQVMMDQAIHSLSPRLNDDPTTTKSMQHQQQSNNNEVFSCICFKPKFSSSS